MFRRLYNVHNVGQRVKCAVRNIKDLIAMTDISVYHCQLKLNPLCYFLKMFLGERYFFLHQYFFSKYTKFTIPNFDFDVSNVMLSIRCNFLPKILVLFCLLSFVAFFFWCFFVLVISSRYFYILRLYTSLSTIILI